jgi:hypothetical protein
MASSARVICLLVARNCERHLPGYFRSVERFADAVVVLDDGSTDATGAVLAREPLVGLLLTNPPRGGSEADDGANRNRLLDAAARLDPEWVISIDADERMPPADALALRRFVETGALPGCAFGLKRLRISPERGAPSEEWVYRLFAFRPGQRFPVESGCFDPVPTSMPPHTWVKTTFRLVPGGVGDWFERPADLPPVAGEAASPYAKAMSSGQLLTESALRIEIDTNAFTLSLYRGLQLERSYPITTGLPATPTPAGVFAVTSALHNPSWIIPRGELTGRLVAPEDDRNPIKEHWLGLVDGIGIHGTRWTRALGNPISLGCVGMSVRDIADLYPHVQLGTPVVVL